MGNFLRYGVAFLIAALVAAVLGLGAAACGAMDRARMLFLAAVAFAALAPNGALIRKT